MPGYLDWNGPKAMNAMGAMIAVRLELAALAVETEAKLMMSEPKSGVQYRRPNTRAEYTASAPGEAPAVRTGALQDSLTHDPPYVDITGWHCIVGTDEPYAPFLELGTSIMAPRPFLRPAMDKARAKIALFLGPIAGAISGGIGRGYGTVEGGEG